ncbi:MAG TPA: thioesterase family protein [Rhizomicrobium sp.]|nr:thioesterase family protein [Rhizomicrobium sp.]
MGNLARDTEVTEDGGKLSATLSRDWEIWGPNGGYVSAIALRAAGKVAPPGHRPATFSVQYLSTGRFEPADVEAHAVKQGRNAWCINVALIQGGKRFLQAQVWTTNKSGGPRSLERAMPRVPPPGALRSWREINAGKGPSFKFWENFDGKPTNFIDDYVRDPRGAAVEEWNRVLDFEPTTDPFLDFSRALILIDTFPWIAFGRGQEGQPDYTAPTLDLTAWFHEPPGPAAWLLAEARSDVAGNGLIHGRVKVWSEDGRAIASGGSNLLHVPAR